EIPGLVWRSPFGKAHAGTDALYLQITDIVRTPLANPLHIDNDLHGQAWHLLPHPKHYRSHNWQRLGNPEKRSPYAAIHTSLGCAFRCSFCMINVFQHTNRYRMRDPKAVVGEMVALNRAYGVETFKFTDELFVLNRK